MLGVCVCVKRVCCKAIHTPSTSHTIRDRCTDMDFVSGESETCCYVREKNPRTASFLESIPFLDNTTPESMTINICATDSNAANEIFNGSILTLSCGEGEGFIFFLFQKITFFTSIFLPRACVSLSYVYEFQGSTND